MGERTEALDAAEKRRIAKQFIEALPFAHSLKMEVQDIGEGVAVIAMPWSDDLVGDPRTGVIHGGAVSALMDTCGGAAVMTHPEAPAGTATIDLRIDYMRRHTGPAHRDAGRVFPCHPLGRLRARQRLGRG